MKTIRYNLAILAFILPIAIFAANGEKKWKHTEEKKYNKECTVNADATVKIDNTFGNVDITTWDQNKVKIDVVVTVSGNNQEKVKEQLNKIQANFNNSASLVEAVTKLEKNSWKWKKGYKMSMKINYTVKMPKTNMANISNDYGDISIDELKGVANINCDYGKIMLGELHATTNKINIDYCSGSTISKMNGGDINADYSGIKVGEAGRINLVADYTASEFGAVDNLNYNCDYGSLKLGDVGSLNGQGDYIGVKIEALAESPTVDASYGSVNVGMLKNTVKNVTIDASYAGVNMKYGSGYSFDFDVDTNYGSINLADNAAYTDKNKKTMSKHYKGHVGSAGSGNTFRIKAGYGGVSITEK